MLKIEMCATSGGGLLRKTQGNGGSGVMEAQLWWKEWLRVNRREQGDGPAEDTLDLCPALSQ